MKAYAHGFISQDYLQWFQTRLPPRGSLHFPSGGNWELYKVTDTSEASEEGSLEFILPTSYSQLPTYQLMGDVEVFDDFCLVYSQLTELVIKLPNKSFSFRFLELITIRQT
jgi:hypothetical protein